MGRFNKILGKAALGVLTVVVWVGAVVCIAVCVILVVLRNCVDWVLDKMAYLFADVWDDFSDGDGYRVSDDSGDGTDSD